MFYVNIIKFLAIVLVTNSHLKSYYPLREVASGGILGNTLFFFGAGILAVNSLEKSELTFFAWYYKRLKRIYPQLWIFMLVYFIAFERESITFSELILKLIAPQEYWFLPAIAAMYPLIFFARRIPYSAAIPGISISFMVLYICYYFYAADLSRWSAEDNVFLKSFFYSSALLAGAAFHSGSFTSYLLFPNLTINVLFLTATYIATLICIRFSHFYTIQFGVNLLALIWAGAVARLAQSAAFLISSSPRTSGAIRFVSDHTLQIYLAQVPLIKSGLFVNLLFPLNLIAILSAILLSAWAFKRIWSVSTMRE